MISEASLIKPLIQLNIRETKSLFLDFCTGRFPGSLFFQVVLKPCSWYSELADDLSARSARKIRLHFQSRAEGNLRHISQKVAEKICSDSSFVKLQKSAVKVLTDDWIKEIAPSFSSAKHLIASSVASVRQYDDENPLKKMLVRKLVNFIDRQFSVRLLSNPETKMLIEVIASHFFSSDPNRSEHIHQAIASTVSDSVKPYVLENVNSAIYDALPVMADCIETAAKENTHAVSNWILNEICSVASGSGVAYAAARYFSDDQISPALACGSVVVATAGLWAMQWLQSASSDIDLNELCIQLNDRYGEQLKCYFAAIFADLHNRWTPSLLHRETRNFIDSIPDELIEKGIRLIAETVISELKL